MKNRTLIGIVCMVLAVALTFIISPLVTRLSMDTVEVPRLSADVQRGAKISDANVEIVKVKKDTLPNGIITDKDLIVGRYAASTLYSGDYVTKEKIALKANSSDDVIASFNGEKFAMSFTIDSFAAGLSGKLQNGDIISLVVKSSNGKAIMPPSFKYVKVITTTTAGGVDQDKVVKNDDGTFDAPATITLLVNATQAQQLADYEEGVISCVLVYRGSDENAQKFLDKQDEYFSSGGDTNAGATENTEQEKSGDDIIKQANDIINGKADHYDVNKAVNGNG